MDDERISYEMLQDLVRQERRSNRITPLEARFWPQVRSFLDEVMESFRAEQSKDPFSRKSMLLRDEVKNARHAADSLFALRERKMSLFALAQREEPKRPEGLTPIEEDVYDTIVATLAEGRRTLLGGDDTPSSAPTPPAAPAPAPAQTTPPPPAKEPAKKEEPAAVPADTPQDDAVTIRALGDIPPFVGPDMHTYLLKEGDVATVPPAIAKLLERRSKAAIIDGAA